MAERPFPPTPILKIELEGLRQQVAVMLNTYSNDELHNLVRETLDSTLTEEWVRQQVKEAVRNSVQQAIRDVADSRALRGVITGAIVAQLTQEEKTP